MAEFTISHHAARPRRTTRRRNRQPKPDRHRMLELIAGCGPLGMPETIMQAHGFTLADMIELVRAGLAAAICERVVEDRLKVTRVRLTEAGAASARKGEVMTDEAQRQHRRRRENIGIDDVLPVLPARGTPSRRWHAAVLQMLLVRRT